MSTNEMGRKPSPKSPTFLEPIIHFLDLNLKAKQKSSSSKACSKGVSMSFSGVEKMPTKNAPIHKLLPGAVATPLNGVHSHLMRPQAIGICRQCLVFWATIKPGLPYELCLFSYRCRSTHT